MSANTIDEKTKISLFVVISAALVAIPAIVGYAIFIYGVSVNAKKGAKAYTLTQRIDQRLDRLEIKAGTKPPDLEPLTELED
jgi:hypothetical protein